MALNKLGQIHKFAQVATDLVDLKPLNVDKVVENKKANCVYFRARAISAGDQGPKGTKWNYNGNYDYFSRKQLEASYSTFVGRSLFLNHDSSSPLKAVGKVLDSYPVEDPETGEFYIECLSRIDRDLHPELAKMVENGDLNSVSMGASCESSMCSICGVVIHSDQDPKCSHLNRLGQKFEAEVDLPEFKIQKGESIPAFAINSGLTFSELSIVSVPADSAALIKTVIANFRTRLQKVASKDDSSFVSELDTLLGLLATDQRETVRQQICGVSRTAQRIFTVGQKVKVAASFPSSDRNYNFSDFTTLNADIKEDYISKVRGKIGTVVAEIPSTTGSRYSVEFREPVKDYHVKRDSFLAEDLQVVGLEDTKMIKEAAAYDVLVWVLGQSSDGAMTTVDLLNAMRDAGFSVGRQVGDKQEMQIFYSALHRAQALNWITRLEAGVYGLTEAGWKQFETLGETVPGKGRIKKQKPEEAPKAEEPAPEAPPKEDLGFQDPGALDQAHGSGCPCPECAAQRSEPEPNRQMWPASQRPKEINTILSKLSALEYAHLQEFLAEQSKVTSNKNKAQEDNSMTSQNKQIKADETPSELPKAALPGPEAADAPAKAPEMAPAPKDPIKGEESDIKKLEEAEKLIKEVKEHEKEELKDLKKEEPKMEEKAPEPMPAMSAKKPTLTAKFTRHPFISRSMWTVFAGDKPVLKATLREICGEMLPEMKALVTSPEYGKRLVSRIESDGLPKVAELLNVKASDEAMEHLRGKEWNTKAHESGHSEVRKMQEGAESAADKSKKAIDRPYGEPGEQLQPMAKADPKVSKEAATEKKAAGDEGYSPKLKDTSNLYEKGGADVTKAHEANERGAEPSKKAIDRPYGEPGDHLKAQAAAQDKTAAAEKGISPEMKDHQKDYEKGSDEAKKRLEETEKKMKTPPHMRVQTSYEAGEHLEGKEKPAVAKQAGGCPCAMAECKCPCMGVAKECACSMGAKMAPAAAATPTNLKEAGKLESPVKDSPETLSAYEGRPKAEPAGPTAGGKQDWDKGASLFAKDNVPSDEAKKAQVGKEAKLEAGEQTLSEAEKEKAFPKGSERGDMEPTPEKAATEAIGPKEEATKIAKLEPGEQKLSETEKIKDEFKPPMGSAKDTPSDEQKAKEIGTEDKAHRLEAALQQVQADVETLKKQIADKDALIAQKDAALQTEKFERAVEAKMRKCRKLVEEMIQKDLLALDQTLVDKHVKEGGKSLLDARHAALKETIDQQLASFMQMPDSLLQVQAQTIGRIKKATAPTPTKLGMAPHVEFTGMGDSDAEWLQKLPWS